MAAGLLTKGPPVEPRWVFIIRCAIIFFSLLVLALTAWSLNVGAEEGVSNLLRRQVYYSAAVGVTNAPAMLIFSAVWTLLTFGITLIIEKSSPQNVIRIAVFITYILSAIFLLSGWAYTASMAAVYGPHAEVIRKQRYSTAYVNHHVQLAASFAAASAMGAVLWVLVIVATVMFCINSLRTEGAPMGSGTEMGPISTEQKGGPVHVSTQPSPAPVYQGYAAPPAAQQPVYHVAPQQGFVQQPQQGYPQQQQGYPQQA